MYLVTEKVAQFFQNISKKDVRRNDLLQLSKIKDIIFQYAKENVFFFKLIKKNIYLFLFFRI